MSNIVFFFQTMFDFFSHCVIPNAIWDLIFIFSTHHVILNLIQDLTFIFFKNNFWFFLFYLIFFQKGFLILSFLFLLYFYFFIKIITTSLRGRNRLRVRSPQFWIWFIHSDYIFPVWLRLASTGLASTQRCKARSLCLG